MRRFIDAAQTGVEIRLLLTLAGLFLMLALAQQLIAIGASYFGEQVAWTATNALRGELAHHCIYLDMTFHNDTPPGKLIERIDGDVMALSNFFSRRRVDDAGECHGAGRRILPCPGKPDYDRHGLS